jgi:hypothetical protein
MRRNFLRSWSIAVVGVLFLALIFLAPFDGRPAPGLPVADFVPPISAAEAHERVAEAQQAAASRRAELARTLDMTSAEALPFVQTVYMGESRYHVSDRAGFLSYWRKNGGVLVFGYPISEEIVEDGRIVQYFERARFEYHPDKIGTDETVLLSLLGRELTADRDFPPGSPEMGEVYFPETGHTLSGKFRQFWEKRGGLPTFGFPISEPLDEANPLDGQSYRVQYFERARFEYHPDELGGFYQQQVAAYGLRLAALREVQLGDLGRQAAERKGYQFSGRQQLGGAPTWSPGIWERQIDVNLSEQRLTAYEGAVPVFSAPIATGKDGFNTPEGSFGIYAKYPMQTMTGSAGSEVWNVPDIPWVQYVVGGVALHGTYWHDQWGTGVRMSHGCINLNIDDAQWLYEWADIGTSVNIHY